ncbi:BLUF domain-containing protein [Mesonia ostreae]|uniref:BLUF domain-containing protein n=1 Tax=Mesonia ostreae TaxID=861110 RepID=A0ABU2KE97_9FLAO|nr:BLUF domain-containing protein [Mesonia ostreae]MDT0293027.1 BLUF domain-containing protein [Mesonia ostreae]
MDKTSSVEVVRNLALVLNANFNEGTDTGYFIFNNEYGNGKIKALKIFFGLEVLSFNICLTKSLNFDYLNFSESYLHCLFIQEGFLDHKFQNSDNTTNASRFQNVILSSNSKDFSTLKLPKDTKLKFVIITLEKTESTNNFKRGRLQELLNDVLKSLASEKSYGYFGNFSNRASAYVKTILKTLPNNLTNRLLIEASVLNVLSCQFLNRELNLKRERKKSVKLSKSELRSVIELTEYIAANLDKPLKLVNLERECGLNQKRIQDGFRYFFQMSVNKYIGNLRILKAKELIETTDLNISEIVYAIGFNSRSYFSKIFSVKYGLLPSEYRKNFHIHNPTYELSYYSTAKYALLSEDFENILQEARMNNEANDITGCLIYHKQNFFQILEGPKEVVLSTFNAIQNDKRHRNIKVIYQGFKSGKTFDNWDMAFLEKPSLFITDTLSSFKLLDSDLILSQSKKDSRKKASKLRTKLMWERARNALLVLEENKGGTSQLAIAK